MICGEKCVSLIMLLFLVNETAEQVQLDVQKWIGLPSNLSYIMNKAEEDRKLEVNTDCPVVLQNSSTIVMSPQHPFQYPAGMCCDWIMIAPMGQVFSVEIIVLDLPVQTKGRCLNGYLAFGYFDTVGRRIGGYSEVCGSVHPDVSLCKLGKEKVWVRFYGGEKITEFKDPYSGFLLSLKLSDKHSIKTDIEVKKEELNEVVIGASIMSSAMVLVAGAASTIVFIRYCQKRSMQQHQRRLTTFRMRHTSANMIANPPNMPLTVDMSDEEQGSNSRCSSIMDKSQISDFTSMDHFYESIQERYSLADPRPHRFTSLQLIEPTENTDQDSFTSVFSESASYVNRRNLPMRPFLSYLTIIGTASRSTVSNETLNDSLSDCSTEDGLVISLPNNGRTFDDSSDTKDFSQKTGQNQQEAIQRDSRPSLREQGTSLRKQESSLREQETRQSWETISSPPYGPRSNPLPIQQISIVRRYPRKRNRSCGYENYKSLKKAKKIFSRKKQTKSSITSDESGDTSLQMRQKVSEFTSTPKDFELMETIGKPLPRPVPKINIFFPSNSEMDTSLTSSNYLSSISSLSPSVSSLLQSSSSNSLMVPKWIPSKQCKDIDKRYTSLPENRSTGVQRMSQIVTSRHKSSATSLETIEEEKIHN